MVFKRKEVIRRAHSLKSFAASNDMGRYKLDYDNNLYDKNLEEVFNEMQGDVILADIDDPDATPKLEKKPSMSQLILNLKSKFGSTSSRKKAKKGIKRVVRNDVYTGRLLWNPNGQWKDKWFHYQDGNLQGFKEVGFKPADVIINIKDCTLTSFTGDDMMKRLNLFKLTTAGDVVHTFAAWNEDDYEAWVECLSYAVQKKEEIHGVNMGVHNKPTSESDETYIIPYERALSNEDSQKTSTSSDNSTARVDSLDSGNDGDESGLESSHTSNQCKIKKANGTTEQNLMLQSFMNSRKDIPPIQQAKTASLRLDFTDDAKKRYSAEIVKSNMSPTFEITPSSVGDLSKPADFKRQKRPTSLNTKQRWSFYGSKKELNKMIARNAEHLQIPAKTQTNNIPLKTQSEEILSRDIDHVSVISQSGSLDSPSSYRPSSADSLLTHTPSSTDAPGFPNSWDGYRNYKKSMSEDEISDCCSMQSTSSIPMTEDHKQEELEDSLREETFLRKRRNSLTLERGEICTQIVALHDPPKKQNKNTLPTAPIATENKKEIISKLESRLGHIDSQIEIIEKKISLTFNPTYKTSKTVKRNNAIISKLRGKPKAIDNTISMSVESLTSSGSRDSRDGQDLVLHKDEYSIPENFVPAPRIKSQSTGGEMKKSDSKLSGFEELLLTTEKLEKSKGVKSKPLLNQPLSAEKRSKSLGSMDLINLRQQQKTANVNNQKYDHSLSNDNQCADESEKIIEDFERFSAILSNQMKMKRNNNIIQV